MIQKGALTEVQFVKNQFFSTIFVRPKKEANKFRTIINLKRGNSYMPYIHFKMEGMKNASDLLNQGDYMTKIEVLKVLKVCLMAYRDSPGKQKVLKVLMGEKALRNACSSLWSRSRPTNIYKTTESSPDSCLLYTSPSPRDQRGSRMPSSA